MVLSTGEIMVLSSGIGNGPTVVICALINPLLKIRVDFSCINMHMSRTSDDIKKNI